MRDGIRFEKMYLVIVLSLALVMGGALSLWAEEAKPAAETVKSSAEAAPAAEGEKPTGEFALSAFSQYIWRGYELSRNSVVVQPSATIGYRGFSANLWGNLDRSPYFSGTGDGSHSSNWNETDWTLSYARNLGTFNLGGGYIYYALGSLNRDAPERADIQEIFATVSLNTLLSPALTAYREIGHYRNWYFLLGASHTFEFGKRVSLKLAASAGYLLSTYADAALFNTGAGYGGYPRFDGSARATDEKFRNFHDGTVSASLPLKIASNVAVTPTLSYTFPLSGDARNEMKGQGLKGVSAAGDRDGSFVYGGLTASFGF